VADAAGDRSEEDRVPQLVPGWEEKASVLGTEEGFLLSRIDGFTSWAELRSVSGVAPARVDECLERWLQDGAVRLGTTAPGGNLGEAAAAKPSSPGVAEGIDASLQLPVEFQERILAFEKRLEQPYHVLLGVPLDADVQEVKRAYFKLSKDFHPDRYFGREIGHFARRLDRIFKKVVLGYELLRDPTLRAELERSLGAERPPPHETGGAANSQGLEKRRWLERLRKQFRLPLEVVAERKFRARQLAEASRVSSHQGNWKEAAHNIRLAIAFDPWDEGYKRRFGEIQIEVNRVRAEDLLSKADGDWDARSRVEALGLYDEVLHCRPADHASHNCAAQLAFELEDFERALEYADRACELAPDSASYHLTRGRVLRRCGLRKKAIEAFGEARRLDPDDSRAHDELRKLRQRPGRTPGGKQ
jgi:curved DNA-binding protein CbpA